MKKAFTLAEALITLLIIGVVAALTIPNIISNYQQQEFKTGLKKAINVLNNAIAMNIAAENETPLTNSNTFGYLMRHMNIMKSTTQLSWSTTNRYCRHNAAFYTADGMRFEFWIYDSAFTKGMAQGIYSKKLYEGTTAYQAVARDSGTCGSYGMANNPSNSKIPPCYIVVDVNGDKGPTPSKNEGDVTYITKPDNDITSNIVSDIFTILITEDRAIPFGVAAQRAIYTK